MMYELVKKNRSYRRFYQDIAIGEERLKSWIDLARLSSSGSNLQPLRYILSFEEEKNSLIFSCLRWAGYLKDWHGPEEGERPSAHIIMLGDKDVSSNYFWDHGIACQSILLGAVEEGFGGCMFRSVDRNKLQEALKIPDRYDILLAIALGKPKETVVLKEMADTADVKYWRDSDGVHYVPKRKLEDLILPL